MAVVAEQRALDEIRDKVEANERLSLEDGLTLIDSDDLLQPGDLAYTARRVRGATDDGVSVQTLYWPQLSWCRVQAQFCGCAGTRRRADAFSHRPGGAAAAALRARELSGCTGIHLVGGESPHV